LKVVKILPEKNLVLVKGSVPGSKGTVVTVRIAKKYKAK
jgi:large subunit ribosomal protein L3